MQFIKERDSQKDDIRNYVVYGAAKCDICFFRAKGNVILLDPFTGSGKNVIPQSYNVMGLMPQDSGNILWNGEPMNDISSRASNHVVGIAKAP